MGKSAMGKSAMRKSVMRESVFALVLVLGVGMLGHACHFPEGGRRKNPVSTR